MTSSIAMGVMTPWSPDVPEQSGVQLRRWVEAALGSWVFF